MIFLAILGAGLTAMALLWFVLSGTRDGAHLTGPPADLAKRIGHGHPPSLPGASTSAASPDPGSDLTEQMMLDARALKQQGKLIEAIKLIRERTGLGLKEAKDAVDRL